MPDRPLPDSRHRRRRPPWKSPLHWAWLFLALALSVWLALSMPQAPGAGRVQTGQTQVLARDSGQAHAVRPGQAGSRDSLARLERRARIFGQLFFYVGLGAMLGAIVEGRGWYRVFSGSLGRISRAAGLPEIVGLAMPTALASGPGADSMLMASHRRGELPSSALLAGGLCNGVLAHISHLLRVIYPVAAAIGLPGLLFFGVQILGGLIILTTVLLCHRFLAAGQRTAGRKDPPQAGGLPSIRSWPDTLRFGCLRAAGLLFRLACVSVPLILAMEWLIRAGALDFWDSLVPAAVSRYFPEQLLTIVAAQFGGLIQSATVSAGLLAQGLITRPQILLAMLLGSVLTSPVNTVRRTLPTTLAIYPPRLACLIVFGAQLARLAVVLAATALLILWMGTQPLL